MKRAGLFLLFCSLSTAMLLWFAGGIEGPNARRPAPNVEDPVAEAGVRPRFRMPEAVPVYVEAIEDLEVSGVPEGMAFTDPDTGEEVRFVFVPWRVKVGRLDPATVEGRGREAANAYDVELLTHRKPRSLTEAKEIADGVPGAYEALVQWRVTAPEARADFLADQMNLAARRQAASRRETVIRLTGNDTQAVRIHDLVQHFVVEGEGMEVQPYLETARGEGPFVVRHEAFEVEGQGLDLRRNAMQERLEIVRDVDVRIYGEIPGPGGQPVFDLGTEAFRPSHLRADGSAVMVREAASNGRRERMSLHVSDRVHAGQTGGRTLDAERVILIATRPPGPRRGAPPPKWEVERFDAEGGVTVEYPGVKDQGGPYLVSLAAERLVHEVAAGGVETLLLEGAPRMTLRGDIPFEGLPAGGGIGTLRIKADEQVWLGPASPSDLPQGADPARYRRMVLRSRAQIERRDTGVDPAQDTLEGDEMTLLLKSERVPSDEGGDRSRFVAAAFAAVGDVRLGGTRMSGMTSRLVAEGLDTDMPVLVAEGPGTAFAFYGLRSGERLLGGREPVPTSGAAAPAGGAPNPAETGEPEAAWVLDRVDARGRVEVETSMGGPSVGLPTRLEGESLGYDRVSDLARLQSGASTQAMIEVRGARGERHTIRAAGITLERGPGIFTARGRVEGTFHLLDSGDGTPTTAGLLGFSRPRESVTATLGVSTNGRIEIHPHFLGGAFEPRLETAQVLRVEGGVVAELRAPDLSEDSLRADFLEIALQKSSKRDPSGPRPRVTSAAAPGTARGAVPTGPTDAQPSPERMSLWSLETETLRAHVAREGFERIEATGGALLEGEEGRMRGQVLTYDAASRTLRARGDGRDRAWAAFGPDEALNEVEAAELDLRLGDDGPVHLAARAPARATLIRREASGPIERFTLACRGDVEVTPTRVTTRDLVEIQRVEKPAPFGTWGPPTILWTDRLVVTGLDLLSRAEADVSRLVATGPRTTLRTGDAEDLTTVWADQIDLDVPTSRATLSGIPGRPLRIQRGTEDEPEEELDQDRVIVDLETGLVYDWRGARVILRGAR
ncbi:MAG: hypothetical protein ACYTG6_01780 [Planctomycetota bacterium]